MDVCFACTVRSVKIGRDGCRRSQHGRPHSPLSTPFVPVVLCCSRGGGGASESERLHRHGTESLHHHGKCPETSASTPEGASVPVPDLDIVLCHVTADYDTLAAAVGLARLRGANTIVVLSGGSNPTVERFLSLFQPLFPIRNPKNVNPERIRWIGVVDCSRNDRLGKCAAWIEHAESVEVYDHHVLPGECDLVNHKGGVQITQEPVGAATTIIVERLRDARIHISPGEATLMSLGIHSDTGSFLFENTCARDARALAWLLECGANQKTIIEYKNATLSEEHRKCLNDSMRSLRKDVVNGIIVGHCFIETEDFVKGLSPVAQKVIELTRIDVLLFTVVNTLKPKPKKTGGSPLRDDKHKESDAGSPDIARNQLSIIARSRPRVLVDLGEILSHFGGGGHAKAAAATIRTEQDPHIVNEEIIRALHQQVQHLNPFTGPTSQTAASDQEL